MRAAGFSILGLQLINFSDQKLSGCQIKLVPPAIILIDFDHCGDKFIKKNELTNFL